MNETPHLYIYTLFDYFIHSDTPLLGLETTGFENVKGYGGPVCEIALTETPDWVRNIRFETELSWSDNPGYHIWTYENESFYRLDYRNSCEFIIDHSGTRLYATWDRQRYGVEDIITYLIGPIGGFILSLRSIPALHASVIEINGKTVAFAGYSGMGKSTLALAFARHGFPVITEDIAPLHYDPGTNQVLVLPGHQIIKVWSDIATHFFQRSLPRITPTWEKRFYTLEASTAKAPKPLTDIYYIQPRVDGIQEPIIERVSALDAFKLLQINLYTDNFSDPGRLQREFELITHITNQSTHKTLTPVKDLNRVESLLQFILDDLS
jgi:hypothetical protein